MSEHTLPTAAVSRASPLMNRFKIGTRVLSGFVAVLALLGVVATIGTLGLTGAGDSFGRFSDIAENAMRVLEIDRNVVGLRRNVALYTGNRDEAALRRVEELKKSLASGLAEAEKATLAPERLKLLAEMKGFYTEYTTQFEKVVQLRLKRDKILNEEMNPAGAAMRADLTRARARPPWPTSVSRLQASSAASRRI